MNRMICLLSALALVSLSGVVRADDSGGDCDHGHCKPETEPACFNLVCHYKFEGHDDHDKGHECSVASTFFKDVTKRGGGEVQDESNMNNAPKLEVTCDGKPIFNNSARRFTGLLGTRIQGETGPDPAITLPRGELHTGPDGSSGDHYSPSTIEVSGEWGFDRANGQCFIWTGNP